MNTLTFVIQLSAIMITTVFALSVLTLG